MNAGVALWRVSHGCGGLKAREGLLGFSEKSRGGVHESWIDVLETLEIGMRPVPYVTRQLVKHLNEGPTYHSQNLPIFLPTSSIGKVALRVRRAQHLSDETSTFRSKAHKLFQRLRLGGLLSALIE